MDAHQTVELAWRSGEDDGGDIKGSTGDVKGDNGNGIEASNRDEKGKDGGNSGSPAAAAESSKKEPAPEMVSYVRLFSFADKYDYALMFFGSIGAAAHGAALPLVFIFFGKLLNGLGSGVLVTHTVNKYALSFIWLALSCLGSSWMEVALWMQSGERQTSKMRAKYLQALLRQDVGYFDTDTKTGEFVNSIASDPLVVQDAIGEKMGNFIHFLATFITGFIVAFTIQWRIAIVTLAIVPIIASAGGFFVYVMTGATARAVVSYAEAGIIVEQATSQIRTVHSFVGERKFAGTYSEALGKTMKLQTKGGLAKGLGMGATYGTLFFCWALLLWYGGTLVRKGTTNGGKALATIFSIIIGSMALGQALPNLAAFANGRAVAFKMFQMIEREPIISKPDNNSQKLESVEGTIDLRSVDFAYPSRPDAPVFSDFSLTIPAGKTVAIVGSSGSGKSTVVSLIERFYDPTAGEVLLDGHNLKALDLKWLRTQIGLVNQEPVLFATTIQANILYGKDIATQQEIADAAKAANALSFIEELPYSYQTQVGEKGVQLSGGQKQRVAIARAMVKNPRVLLMDEATSALDTNSEMVVQEALDRLMIGRTTVVVAHRLSTVRNADSIAVVQQGRIVEMGTHDELISREDGAYFALVRLQELAASTEGGGAISRRPTSSASSIPWNTGEGRVSNRASRSSFRRDSSEWNEGRPSLDALLYKKKEEQASKGSFARLLALARADWKYGLGGTIGSALAGCLNPAYAYLLSGVLQQYYNSNHSDMKKEIAKSSLILVALGVVSPFIYILQHYSLGVLNERLVTKVRERMFATILRNEIGWFDEDENNSSQIAARLASDATNVRAVVGDRASIIMQNLALLLISFIVSLFLSWRMTLVMSCAFPLLVFSNFCDAWFLQGFAGDQAKAYTRATRVAGEAVANIRTVAAFNAENKVQGLFLKELEGPAKRTFLRGQVAGFGYGTSQAILYAAYALGLWYAGHLIASGEGTFGHVIKVFFIMVICSFAASETLTLSPDIVKGGQAVESVFKVLDRRTEIEPEDPDSEEVAEIRGDIALKDVAFAYPSRPDVIVFRSLSLSVRSGNSLALVGSSGSGKSSVVALIERFYDPMSGQVLIDGKDIRGYNLKSVRRRMALVQQEPALFSTSVYENILFGKEGASEAEVMEAAKAAYAHEFVSALPDGYRTQVGDRGVQISGGQKQRVAIARAVLKNPSILLLDEATSALDAGSERIVQEALDRLMTGRTTIIIAHRLSTIRGADAIAVVQEGSILEEGTHKDLLAGGGAYSRLVNFQNRVDETQSSSAQISRD